MIKNPLYLSNPSAKPKDMPAYDGPYYIVRRALNGPYVIRDDNMEVYERRVPIDQIKVVSLPDGAIEEHKHDEWEIKSILSHRRRRNKDQYLVRWKASGYPDQWLDRKDIHADRLIRDYVRAQQAKNNARVLVMSSNATPTSLDLVVSRL